MKKLLRCNGFFFLEWKTIDKCMVKGVYLESS